MESEDVEASSSRTAKRSSNALAGSGIEVKETSDSGAKKTKLKRKLKIAVTGCSHGEMDKIYACAAEIERREGWCFDLLICTGDYQAVRNFGDLEHMHVPSKYRSLQTFYRYYSGEVVAPILTLVVGGNHEASGYMQELPYGGWIAPRIYYMGHASVISFAGLRIAGLSGIYNNLHYDMGHFERPPFAQYGSVVSVYHVRSVDVFRLKQLEPRRDTANPEKIDFMISHDWPSGITDYGDVDELLRVKPHFAEDLKKSALGNPATMTLLHQLRPRYWLSSHLHCAFAALVPHEDPLDANLFEFTHFLALDKAIPGRQFLQALDIEVEDDAELVLKYDPTWLAILKATDKFTSATNRKSYMPSAYPPSDERWDYRPSEQEVNEVVELFGNDFTIPENFVKTAPPQDVFQATGRESEFYYRNPQTTAFCKKLNIQDLNGMLCALSQEGLGTPYFLSKMEDHHKEEDSSVDKEVAEECFAEVIGEDCFFIDKTPNESTELLGGVECASRNIEEDSDLKTWTEEVLKKSDESSGRVGNGLFKRRNMGIVDHE